MNENRRRKISVRRKITMATGVVLAGVTAAGIALITAQSGTGSQYSLDDLRQQVLAMRPQVFEPVEQEQAPPEELHTSLKKRYAFAPRAFPAGNSLGTPLPMPSLTPSIFPGPLQNDRLILTPVSGPGFAGENLSIHTTLSGDFSVKGLSVTNGKAATVPLTEIPSVLGGGSPHDGILSIVNDILGGGTAPPGTLLKRSADTSFLLSGAGDGFPDSEELEIARNSVPQDLKTLADAIKTPSANGVPAPAPLLLFGTGLTGLGLLRWARRRLYR